MKRIITLNTRNLHKSKKDGGCGECQTSCQSACKTSCGVANQECVNTKNKSGQAPYFFIGLNPKYFTIN